MRTSPRGVAAAVSLGAALAGVGYTAFAIERLRAFARKNTRDTGDAFSGFGARPSVVVLKPVYGAERALEENLRSFCAQDYAGCWSVVLGVHDEADPALPLLHRIANTYPERVAVVAGDGTARHRNPKIANVASMLERMPGGTPGAHRAEIVVIADSDMRVSPEYLDAVVAPFADPRVGAVTAIYRGEPADPTLPSLLAAMGLTEQFAPSALVATAVEPLAYTFGSTMAVRSRVLGEFGGLAALGEHLADDHVLGRRVTQCGYRVALAHYVVTNVVAERSLRGLLDHEVRWARTIRAVRPASYPGIVLTYPLVLACLHLALARSRRPAIAVCSLAVFARLALHRTAHAVLGSRRVPPARLIPLREALGFAVWVLGLSGRSVRWHRDRLHISSDGELREPS